MKVDETDKSKINHSPLRMINSFYKKVDTGFDRFNKLNNNISIPSPKNLISLDGLMEKMENLVLKSIEKLVNYDFQAFVERLTKEQKKKIAYCLKFDIYPPLLSLDLIAPVLNLTDQNSADKFLKEHLEYWKLEKNLEIYDFVPKSLRTFGEINQLKELEKLSMYKLMIIYCLERIEYILTEIQLIDQKVELTKVETSQKAFRNIIDFTDNDSEFVKDLLSQISMVSLHNEHGYKEINLYKRFDQIQEEYDKGIIPLNRNLFLHGRVKESEVDYLIVQKAILAYAFFEQLYALKTSNEKDLILRRLRRKGLSKRRSSDCHRKSGLKLN
ncbi:hypothetical protein [Enterococcus mundtii]|uniref:hypothetical protein n=1 Tax=Enterococcus mundtii TaxID=53346 RepID=UPI001F61DB24|nr:hypothetical protein [Enterococcus mundtii]